jgi:CHASE1-domain containing sensor protein
MSVYEIVTIFLTILSFFATVAIAFLIYFLEKKNEKKKIQREIRQGTKKVYLK